MTSSDKFKQLIQQIPLDNLKYTSKRVSIIAFTIKENSIVCMFVKTIQHSSLFCKKLNFIK